MALPFFVFTVLAKDKSNNPSNPKVTKTAQAQKETKAPNKATDKRSPSSRTALSQQINLELNNGLEMLAQLCNTRKEADIKEKLDLMNLAFINLRNTIRTYSKQDNISESDGTLLEDVKNNIPPNSIYYTKTPLSRDLFKEMDLVDAFMTEYGEFHKLQDDAKPKDFPDEWAKKIHASLSCLYNANN